jgi:hypothetical protein
LRRVPTLEPSDRRLVEDTRLQQTPLAERLYGKSSPDGAVQRLRSIAAGFAKGSRRK